MKDNTQIPSSNIARLPRYFRFLSDLSKKGITRISSNELAEIMCVTASQIRQDFSCFGLSGQQGYGYSVDQLKDSIAGLLGLGAEKKAILLGVGNLGKAVATLSFEDKGFRLIGAFDPSPEKEGITVGGITVRSSNELADFCKNNKPACAFLCLPEENAPDTVKNLIELGVEFFWNFSHYDIKKDFPQATVENVHLSDSLMKLSYSIATNDK